MAKEPEQLELLRKLPFVKALRYRVTAQGADQRFAGTLEIHSPSKVFHFLVEEKRSFLTKESVNELIARVERLRGPKKHVILFAPYIARPTADSLIKQKIALVDQEGNLSLDLGTAYHWHELSHKQKTGPPLRYPGSPGPVQLLVQYLTHKESLGWSVWKLAEEIDVKHAWVAVARKELQVEGLLIVTPSQTKPLRTKRQYRLGPMEKVLDRIVSGYSQLLRPRRILGRYRYPEKTPDAFLKRLAAETEMGQYALTGAPAADILQLYYVAPEVPIFCDHQPSQAILDRLRLLPDREGPVTFLRAFGNVVFGEERKPHRLAPPCLIYAELLGSSDPRAHEVAEKLRQKFLT